MFSLSHVFARLSLECSKRTTVGILVRNVSSGSVLSINTTPCLYAMPMKKKRKLDPQILRAREEKRKRKLEKSLRLRSKMGLNLKPIEELQVPYDLLEEKEKRSRPLPNLSPEEQDKRALVLKSWTKFRNEQYLADVKMLKRILSSQQRALNELRRESVVLYYQAVQSTRGILPHTVKGPAITPRIETYDYPDGEVFDVSHKWD